MTFGQKVLGNPLLQVIADEWIDYSQTATINGQIVNISDTTQFAKVLWQHILQGESQ